MMKFANPLSFLVIFALIVQNHSISEKRLCVDEKCVGVISLGKTIKNYAANQEGILSFKVNSDVKIKSKSSDSTLWGVEIDGKNGYAPKSFIQENKVLHKKGLLVPGVPDIPPPKRSKSKLKSSETAKPELEATTTAPLPGELGNEKILTDGGGNVNVTPAQTVKVVDGTEIPLEVETATKLTSASPIPDEDEGIVEDMEIESTNKSTSNGDLSVDDEEDEYDDDDEDDDDEFLDDEEEEFVEEKPTQLKADIVPEEKKLVENGTEFPSNLVQTESKPEADSSAAEVPLKVTGSDAPALPIKPLSIEIDSKETENVTKQDSEPSLVQGLQGEPSIATTVGQVQPDPTVVASNIESKPEVVEQLSDVNSNETVNAGTNVIKLESSTPTAEVPVVESNTNSATISEKDLSVEQAEGATVKIDTEVPTTEAKSEVLSDSADVKSNEITEVVNSSNEAAKPEDANSGSEQFSELSSPSKDIPEKQVNSTENEGTQNANTPVQEAASEISVKTEGTGSTETDKLIDVPQDGNKESENAANAKSSETVSNLNPVSTLDTQIVTEQPANTNPKDKSEPKIEETQAVKKEDNEANTAATQSEIPRSAGNLAAQTVTEQQANTSAIEEALAAEKDDGAATKQESSEKLTTEATPINDPNSASNLGAQTVTEQSTNINPTNTLEPKIEETQAVMKDDAPSIDSTTDADVIAPKEVTSKLPPVTLNELLKSRDTRFLKQNKHDELTNNNDLPSETESVTKVPKPTEPEIDVLNNDPFEFDVTTPNPMPPVVAPPKVSQPPQQQVGLFQTILGTVKGFLPSQEPTHKTEFSNELDRILFPNKEVNHAHTKEQPEEYCERDDSCPPKTGASYSDEEHLVEKDFIESLSEKVLEIFDLLACMAITAAATLLFTFGYYCLSQCRKENQLIAKLNVVERSLLASNKEASILKHDLGETCGKLASIENNSFGSNDMVIAVKKELEISEEAKIRLEEQVVSLEKELENAAEAGLELNKIVSELLNNQSGDESIISSVEELQRQLNEQQHTILEINAILADKSRENSELQLILAEQNAKFGGEIASLQQDNDELEGEKNVLKSKLDEMKTEFEQDITKALEGKNAEIKRLQADIVSLRTKVEEEHRKWQTSVAKVEALEECLKTVKRDPSIKVSQIIDVANVQAELLDIKRQRTSLKEKLESEMDTRKLLEDQAKTFSEEVEKLKHNFNQSEKDKLEAQTRLEVLSNYFKDKENQLQKELSLKEAMWLKQQGETTSTVDRLTNMQEEIQTLKSQNDSLRAEIEAQLAAHKAQIGTLENRAHETWLAARQSERRYEEARSDATALRRKLTSLVGGNTHALTKENNLDVNLAPPDMNNAPSPVHMQSPGSPLLGRMPPPPFIPPPFMGPPLPHFMGIPPFMPPGEMRPPPMGRLMSPPPPPGPPHLHRYPIDDDDDEDEIRENSRGHWRDTYSPPRHSYRYSPDRYIYNPELIWNHDTESDFSPPASPRERSHRSGSRSGSYKGYSPPPQSATNQQNMDRPQRSSKGQMSSGSEKSYNSWKGKSKGMV